MSAQTTVRPFQVGDTVKITDYDIMTGQTIRTHTGKIRSLKDMSASDASDWVTCIADVDEPYLMGKSDTLHTVAIVHLIPARTHSTWPSNQTIELLEPATLDPAVEVGDTVTLERPSSNDHVDGVVNDVSPEGFVLDGWGKRFRLGDDYNGLWTLTGHQPAPTDPSDGVVTSTPAPSDDAAPSLWTDSYGDEHELHPVGTAIVYNGIEDHHSDLDGESAVITGHDLSDEVTPYEIRFTRVERMASPHHFSVPAAVAAEHAPVAPALVALDLKEEQQERTQAYQRVMGAALEWEYADSYYPASSALDPADALDALRAAVREYRESEAKRREVVR